MTMRAGESLPRSLYECLINGETFPNLGKGRLADHPGVIGRWLESKCPVRPLLRFALYAAIESCFIISLPTSHGVCMRTRAIVIFLLAAWCWRAPLAAQATDSSAEAALRAAMAE